ncbi:SDR family NAD(P)-dependent oxidoreductase [Bradyrhizobium sp. SSUT77]|uniref:SDR family NAD(P)-dependent oxidoreductase n=1 Tax=Bradyrhizobium sp. SSUT77 TaxID=3040603 RepID=UPI003265D652
MRGWPSSPMTSTAPLMVSVRSPLLKECRLTRISKRKSERIMDYALPNFCIDLKGQNALVTGASAGLGVRFAKTLARCGAQVALTARRLDRLESVAAEISAAGGKAVPLQLDVTDADQLTKVVAEAERQLGPVTILVNNAGIPDAQRATKMPMDLIDRVLDTNVRAPYVLSCEVARRLIAAKLPGRIVNLASSSAYSYGGNGAALYSISKAAVVRMTEALAVEWAKFNINVNAIAPGAFSSEMMDGMLQRVGDITKGFPRPRIGDPAQLDSTLLFLVSPSSDFVTGTCVRVDDVQTGR